MGRPRSITDGEIREAARAVFVEHGPGAPVSLVAKRLGVSHAALFGRAGSKERLMMEALRPDRPRALAWLAEPPPREGVAERLVEILRDLMSFFHRVVPNLVVLKAAGRSIEELPRFGGDAPPPVGMRAALAAWLERAVDAGSVGRLSPAPVAEGLLGAMEARCFNAYLGGEAFAPGDDEAFVRTLVRGLVEGTERTRAS
jgi:AcrR family transcriptional regulator